MKKIAMHSTVTERLLSGFSGHITPVSDSFFLGIRNQTMSDAIKAELAYLTGPLYAGELEKQLLDPLVGAVESLISQGGYWTPGFIQKLCYRTGASYAITAEYLSLTSYKSVGEAISVDLASTSRAWTALVQSQPSGDAKSLWSDLKKALAGSNDASIDRTLAALAFNPYDVVPNKDAESNLLDTFKLLARTTGLGSGIPLSPDDRKSRIATLTMIQRVVDQMLGLSNVIPAAILADNEDTPSLRNFLAEDGYVLAYWFLTYLKASKQAATLTPQVDILSSPQHAGARLQRSALNLSEVYTDIAASLFSSDLAYRQNLIRSTFKFYAPILGNQFSAVQDLEASFAEGEAHFSKIASRPAVALMDSVVNQYLKFTGAEYIVHSQLVQAFSKFMDDLKSDVTPAQDFSGWIPTTSQSLELQPSQRMKLVSYLASIVQAFSVAVAYAGRAKEITLVRADAFVEMSTPMSLPNDALSSHVGEVKPMSEVTYCQFDSKDLLARRIPKYVGKDANQPRKWVLKDYLYKPVFLEPLLASLVVTKPYYIWPTMDTIRIGDPVVNMFAMFFLPYPYTKDRSQSYFPNTNPSVLAYLEKITSEIPPRELVMRMAEAYHEMDAAGRTALANTLASHARLYVRRKGESSFQLEKPTLPAIYGMPTNAFYSLLGDPKFDPATAQAAVLEGSADDITLKLVFYTHVPKPQDVSPVLFHLSRGIALGVPVYKSSLDYIQTDSTKTSSWISIVDKLAMATPKDLSLTKEDLLECNGWSEYPVILPHILFDAQPPIGDIVFDATELTSRAYVKIMQKTNPVDRSVAYKAASSVNLVLFDYEDEWAELQKPDFVPKGASSSHDALSITDEGSGGSGGAKPAPAMGTDVKPAAAAVTEETEAATQKIVASVTQAPAPNVQNSRLIMDNKAVPNVPPTVNLNESTSAGDPIGEDPANLEVEAAASGSSSAEATATGKKKKKYKITVDGVEQIIEIAEGEVVPEGAIPVDEDLKN